MGWPQCRGLSHHHLIHACETNLQWLKTDYIDLYQLHERDDMTPLEETLAVLEYLVNASKVRHVIRPIFQLAYYEYA
ncbi:aldo/keto reductase [Sodalis sp.]|uniref:aldo/keto reductase n=1 Tax=Sodalis sp. (in: enterobacteria) TaxID=1898979 RepID=UPI003873B495